MENLEGAAAMLAASGARAAVTIDTARAVLWFFGDREFGIEGGAFVSRLLDAAAAADSDNLARLEFAFPDVLYAFRSGRDASWGLDWLRGIARAESEVCS